MTVYISGPITGIANRNKKSFCAAYTEIARLKKHPRLRNMKIIDPIRIGAWVDKAFSKKNVEPAWTDYMRECIKKLCAADCVYFLKGWDASEGACVERYIAKRLCISCADSIEELKKIMEAESEN
jgi:hypothetical protein